MIVLRGILSKKIMAQLHAGTPGNLVTMAESLGESLVIFKQCIKRMRALGAIDLVAVNTFNLTQAGVDWCKAQESKLQPRPGVQKIIVKSRTQPNSVFELAEKPIKRIKNFYR